MDSYFLDHSMPKKRRLGPQNENKSLGPETAKNSKCASIKETEKLKEKMVGVKVE